jgi:hypothetical protein
VAGSARAVVRRHTAGFRNETEGSADLADGREADYLPSPSHTAFGGVSLAAGRIMFCTEHLECWMQGNLVAVIRRIN